MRCHLAMAVNILKKRWSAKEKEKQQGNERPLFLYIGAIALFSLFIAARQIYASSVLVLPPVIDVGVSAATQPQSSSSSSTRSSHKPVIDESPLPSYATQENPWYGWQPATTIVSSATATTTTTTTTTTAAQCSWRECFRVDHHNCTKCRDSLESWGEAPPAPSKDWVPDVTMLKRMYLEGRDAQGNPWPPPLDDELCEAMDDNSGNDNDNDNHLQLFQSVPIRAQPFTYQGPKVLCLMYTMEPAHATSVRAARETWAAGCDGFLAFSTRSDPRIPAISVHHAGAEEYNNMWQKVRSIWKFVGRHYINDFDFFHLGGDDMYVLPQNLRDFLATKNATEDHFLGHRLLKGFKGSGSADNVYNVGGPGYTLSRPTLRKFFEIGLEHDKCLPAGRRASEDVFISKCFRAVFGIRPVDTRDEQGRERFHHFSPASHYIMRPSTKEMEWYFDASKPWGYKVGTECCAPDSVAFHYIKQPAMVRHLHKLLYGCSNQQ
jgi:glycoprotein-N-acetylgalactosamine 3-beta-galactosyltransferase